MNADCNREGVRCQLCGTWNTHDECGVYAIWVPMCKECRYCLEILPEDEEYTKDKKKKSKPEVVA